MARSKKETALTPEERLQAALVPDWEWPYRLPENWCWVKLTNVIELISGRDASLSECNDNGVGIPYILGASNIEGNSYTIERWIEKPLVVSKNGDILLSVKGTIGKLYIQQEEEINISRQIMAIRPINAVNRSLLYFFLQSVCDELREAGNGLIPGISRSDILEKSFPLIPLDEQQRIVERIERLFAKLDEAKEKAQTVLDSFETRKAAILHKAFTGELTAKWREEHGIGMESWKTTVLSDVGEVITGSTPDTKHPEFYGGDIPFIKPTELNQGRHVVCSADTLTEEGKNVSRPIRAGTTCICCIGATISKCGFIEVDAVTNQQINSVVPYSFMDDIYVYYYCCSTDFKNELISNASATTLPIINKKKTSLLKIVYPEKPEQTEIVRILDGLFAKEQQAKEAAEAVLEKIDLMKKAILARAFRGELGTNDPKDEPAVELLKKIL